MLKFVVCLMSVFLSMFSYAVNHHPQEFLRAIAGSQDEGEKIVQHFCANCHAIKPLIALGAPKINDEKDWEERVKKGIAELVKNTEEGYNAMPARGGCFECSDEQLLLAILAMLPERSKEAVVSKNKIIK